MPALPNVGGDVGLWGTELNNYLLVAHNADGSLLGLAYNVKDGRFGAKGDGTTDDTAAIQAAIQAAQNAGGGIVWLPAGSYKVSSTLTVTAASVTLAGAGVDATVITQATNNIDGIKLGTAQVTPFTQLNGLVIRDLTVQMPTSSTGSGINATGMGVGGHFDNVKTGQGTIGFLLEDIDRCVFRDCQAFNYAGAGIVCRQGHANTWGTVTFENCASVANTASTNCVQFDADAGQGSPNKFDRVTFLNCHFFSNPGTAGVIGAKFLVGAQASSFINCLWENPIQHVVTTAEVDISFIGCSYLNVNFGTTPTTDTFYLNSFSQVSVYDCNFQQSQNLFNGVSGSPRVGVWGINKNNGNLTTIFAGSYGAKFGNDIALAGDNVLALGTSGTSRMGFLFAANVIPGQDSAARVIATNANIGLSNTSACVRLAPTGAVTGITIDAGGNGGQEVTVINESAFTVTFAASGTSHVADGASDVLAATSARKYVWDAGTSLWYRLQ